MHKICFGDGGGLKVELDSIEDSNVEYYTNDYLKTAGFVKVSSSEYIYKNSDKVKFDKTIGWIKEYFIEKFGMENVDICNRIEEELNAIQNTKEMFQRALKTGREIKSQENHNPHLPNTFKRDLMDYQRESVMHMIEVGNAANFSVPGSGKTTITYAALSKWISDGTIEKIIVIGPVAAFLPWEEEFESCFGKKAKSCRISGNIASEFHNIGASYDIFLMHFNTAMNRHDEIQSFMTRWKTALIIDESHYFKSPALGRWAKTALVIAPYAKRRIALSGTPMPNNAMDLWTQITFLWPHDQPLGSQQGYNDHAKKHGIGRYKSTLDSLFCRIKKSDLDLPKPKWNIIEIELSKNQRLIYDAIAAKTLKELDDIDRLNLHDQSRLQKLRLAKMMRLLQTASNPTLLGEMSSTFNVDNDLFAEQFGIAKAAIDLSMPDRSIMDYVEKYTGFEIPSKIVIASKLAKKIVGDGDKVIIWSSFIHNMTVFQESTLNDFDPIIINGRIPKDQDIPGNRDELLNKFKNGNANILIASPASLSESVSLHKNTKGENVCHHAIYFDRNFNGAQYMQSMDRIHRIGMDDSIIPEYHLIIAKNTIDGVINKRLDEKWKEMMDALNDLSLVELDTNPLPEDAQPDFEKDYQATLEYLRKIYGGVDSVTT